MEGSSDCALQVNSVSFFEHHPIEGAHQALGSGATPHNMRRLCVMETEVTNRSEGPLQVHKCHGICRLINHCCFYSLEWGASYNSADMTRTCLHEMSMWSMS